MWLRARCPACRKGKLFSGLLAVVDECAVCGTSLKSHDSGDGPAFFAIVIVGLIVVPIAAIVEYKTPLPLWIGVPLWGGMVIGGSLLVLRAAKSALIAMHYRLHGKK